MYCQNCGKEIPTSSNYCPNCGTKIGQRIDGNELCSWLLNFYSNHKRAIIAYGIWILLHITLWIFANPIVRNSRNGNTKDLSEAFYPFDHPLSKFWDADFSLIDNIDVYDFSEFFFYTILLPFVMVGLVKLFPSFFTKEKLLHVLNFLKKHKTKSIVYAIWTFIHLLIFAFSPTGIFCEKNDFYPFNDALGSVFQNGVDELSLTDTRAYDSSEFFFYILLLPIIILCIGKIFAVLFKSIKKDAETPSKIISVSIDTKQMEHETLEEDEMTLTSANESIKSISTLTYLTKRLFASLIDKFAIIAITVILFFVVAAINKEYVGELGVYSALFHMSGEEVESCAIGSVMQHYPGEILTKHQAEIDEYHGYLVRLDVIVTLIFAIINIIYYCISEMIWKASYGKHVLGFRLKDAFDTDIDSSKVVWRAIVFLILMLIMIGLRWLIGVNYYVIIFLFFLFLDTPVLFLKRSLIDQFSRTKLVYTKK